MSMMESVSASRAALTPKELEVLQLLAAGHTVKSIAAQLDRSEASINERLRDARRKTGVGSSRALARLLFEQKIWDRNFDLPMPPAQAEGMATLPDGKRPRSKGKLAMLFALPLAAMGLIIAGTDSMQRSANPEADRPAAALQSPLVGNWSLDVARIPADERPRRVTIRFRTLPDQRWNTVVDIENADGATMHSESTAALDGVAVPLSGNIPSIDSGSLRQPSPNTLVMTLGKDGRRVSTRVYTVSGDGKSMTETIAWAADGMPKLETTYFNRVD